MRKIKQKQNEYRALGEPSFKASFLLAGRQRFSLPCSLEKSCIFGNEMILKFLFKMKISCYNFKNIVNNFIFNGFE